MHRVGGKAVLEAGDARVRGGVFYTGPCPV